MTKHPGVSRLHHHAWRCRDSEETRAFYEDVLGMKLAIFLRLPHYEQPGDRPPFTHLFFEMNDGSYIAFFDLGDNQAADPSPNTPSWCNHMALHMNSIDEVMQAKARLEANGIDVVGLTDHKFVKSIYFFDPNGHRVELAADIGTDDQYAELKKVAMPMLDEWSQTKKAPRHADWLHEVARAEQTSD